MPNITIVIRSLTDKEPALADVTADELEVGELKQFTILEGGMESGATSVSFYIVLPDGTKVLAETSAAIFNGMAGALIGAEQRFIDNVKL